MPSPPPPPDFRYVSLSAGSSPATAIAAGLASATGSLALLVAHGDWSLPALGLALGIGGATGLAVRLGRGPVLPSVDAEPAPMAIVPWGILVNPDSAAERVLRWAAVARITVKQLHEKDVAGTPATAWSFVTVETPQERFIGRAAGAVALERLLAHLRAYADESSRPVSHDLAGARPIVEALYEPVVGDLLRDARELLREGSALVGVAVTGGSYRQVGVRAATENAVETLRGALRAVGAGGDPRALAALIAGELGVTALVPELLALVTVVHPLVAATARAAALRLGADPITAGSLDEVSAFLQEEDLAELLAWSKAGRLHLDRCANAPRRGDFPRRSRC